MNNASAKQRGTLFLIGGGNEDYHSWSDSVYGKLVKLISGGKIAILAYKDDANWMSTYLQWLGASEATTFIFANKREANSAQICDKLRDFDAIFMEGGHQQIYLNSWKGTLLEDRIREHYFSGKVVAGTSAGAMLMGEIAFISKNGRVHPDILFQNPFLQSISLEDEFLDFLPNTIIDTHFSERGRLIRILPLMARVFVQKESLVTGVGIDEETALVIRPDLVAEIIGFKTTTFLVPTEKSQIRFQFPKPPVFTDLAFHRLGAGAKFDFKHNRVLNTTVVQPEKLPPASKLKNNVIFLGADSIKQELTNGKHPLDSFFLEVGQKDAQLTVLASQQSHELASEFERVLRLKCCSKIVVLPITNNKKENLIQAPIVKQSECIVVAGNNLAEMITFLRSSAPVAKAFRTRLKTGVMMAFLSDAIKLAGRWAILSNSNPPETIEGLNIIKNAVIAPNLLESRDKITSTLDLVYATLNEKSVNLGILMENQSQLTLTTLKTMNFFGNTGTWIIDMHSAQRDNLPEETEPGIFTWTNARLHLLHDAHEIDLKTYEIKAKES